MEKNEIAKRAYHFLGYKGFTIAQMAELLEMDRQTVSNNKSGKRGIKLDTILTIVEQFSDLSTEWLLRGNGPMILTNDQSTTNVVEGNYNITASPNSQVNVGGSKITDESTDWIVPNVAMAPEFVVGDRLTLNRQEYTHIINGNAYVLNTKMGMLLRYVYEEKNQYVCKAIDGRYTDTIIKKEEVFGIYAVVGMLRMYY